MHGIENKTFNLRSQRTQMFGFEELVHCTMCSLRVDVESHSRILQIQIQIQLSISTQMFGFEEQCAVCVLQLKVTQGYCAAATAAHRNVGSMTPISNHSWR